MNNEEMIPRLCGFIYCNGREKFTLYTGDFPRDTILKVEDILEDYTNEGSSVRNCWDMQVAECFNKEYYGTTSDVLCGFLVQHGEKDYSVAEMQLPESVTNAINKILVDEVNINNNDGISVFADCWDKTFSEML